MTVLNELSLYYVVYYVVCTNVVLSYNIQSYRQRTQSRDFLFLAGISTYVGGAMRATSSTMSTMHNSSTVKNLAT